MTHHLECGILTWKWPGITKILFSTRIQTNIDRFTDRQRLCSRIFKQHQEYLYTKLYLARKAESENRLALLDAC